MKVVAKKLKKPLASSIVRLALVQLTSPFSLSNPELKLYHKLRPPRFEWENPDMDIPRREKKISAILNTKTIAEQNVQILVFPEYSVPRECHARLQKFADTKDCIVVGGSYYETGPTDPFFRSNVCPIFLPHEEEPVFIFKEHGFHDEEKALAPLLERPKVARLIITGPDKRVFGISVYICLDYLIPYAKSGDVHQSILDWDHPGLTIVTMCSGSLQLLKGQAAFDVRRMRGEGKFVALCNCSGLDPHGVASEGSALLGPTATYRKEQDVIGQLPSQEGFIYAELSLSDVAVEIKKPDTTVVEPVKDVILGTYEWDPDFSAADPRPLPVNPATRQRGVWHPAFLKIEGYKIVIQLLEKLPFVDFETALALLFAYRKGLQRDFRRKDTNYPRGPAGEDL